MHSIYTSPFHWVSFRFDSFVFFRPFGIRKQCDEFDLKRICHHLLSIVHDFMTQYLGFHIIGSDSLRKNEPLTYTQNKRKKDVSPWWILADFGFDEFAYEMIRQIAADHTFKWNDRKNGSISKMMYNSQNIYASKTLRAFLSWK